MQTVATETRAGHGMELAATLPGRIVLGLAATAVVAAAAHVAVPLPFTPVPLTLQPLAVLGVGLALGPWAGMLTMFAYLAEGLCGLPVFSPTGPGGAAQLLGPTGGFLMAYPLVVAVVGGLTRRLEPRLPRFTAALLGGVAAVGVLFLCGAGWLMHWAHLPATAAGLHRVWIAALGPFLPSEAVKVVVAAGIYSTLARVRRI